MNSSTQPIPSASGAAAAGPAAPVRATLRQRWAAGETTVGAWSFIDHPAVLEVMAGAGYDLVCIDLQHGFASFESAVQLMPVLQGRGTAGMVRVPWARSEQVMRALDLGAEAVLVPMVSTVEQAREAASACRYAPEGSRSWGQVFRGARRQAADAASSNAEVACVLMIETMEGLRNLPEIVEVPGVHGIYVGPNDLSLSAGLGRVLWNESEELSGLIQQVIDVTVAAGLVAGVDCMDAAAALHWRARGARLMLAANDTGLLVDASSASAAGLREIASAPHPGQP